MKQQWPILYLPIDLFSKMYGLAAASLPNEILGVGEIDDKLMVLSTDTLHQKVAPSFCKADEGAMQDYLYQKIMADIDTEQVRFRWHSHGRGGVFWSMWDEQDIESWTGAWVVNLLINARGEMAARLDLFEPLRLTVPLEVELVPNAEAQLGYQQTVAEYCKEGVMQFDQLQRPTGIL